MAAGQRDNGFNCLRIMDMRTMIVALSCLLICQVSNGVNVAESEYKTSVMVYKKVGDVELKTYIYFPKNHKVSDNRAGISCFVEVLGFKVNH